MVGDGEVSVINLNADVGAVAFFSGEEASLVIVVAAIFPVVNPAIDADGDVGQGSWHIEFVFSVVAIGAEFEGSVAAILVGAFDLGPIQSVDDDGFGVADGAFIGPVAGLAFGSDLLALGSPGVGLLWKDGLFVGGAAIDADFDVLAFGIASWLDVEGRVL